MTEIIAAQDDENKPQSLSLMDTDAAIVFRADGRILTLISAKSAFTSAVGVQAVVALFSDYAYDDLLRELMRRLHGEGEKETLQ